MNAYAELELGITPTEAGKFALRFRFWQPGSAAEVALGPREAIQITLDPSLLAGAGEDALVYGKMLGEMVFANEAARLALEQARAAALGAGSTLRLRLFLEPVSELHSLRWETLILPEEPLPLGLRDDVVFSRFLASGSLQRFGPPERSRLRALVVVSNPANLPPAFPPLDVEGELARARAGMVDMDVRELRGGGYATLEAINTALREEVDILYLVAHGGFLKNLGMVVLLEKADGRGDLVPVKKLVDGIGKLPLLAVLVSCQSADSSQAGRTMMALGPALVQRGVPAVVAMQGNVTFPTMERFLPAFFRELQRDGVIDHAVSAGRAAVQARPDWWMPVLFSRLRDNQLLRPPALAVDLPRKAFEPVTVYVPPGPFFMGRDPAPGIPLSETPRCSVDLPAYRIGKYPVTNREYAVYVEQMARGKGQLAVPLVTTAMEWRGMRPPADRLDFPVTGLTWYQARAYCGWLSEAAGRRYRLPNEAEWEKAACGVEGALYPWGEDWQEQRCCTQPDGCAVDAYPAQGPYGCFDLVGGAPEWTLSLWGLGIGAPDAEYRYPWQDDDRNNAEAHALLRRVVRGGVDAPPRMTAAGRRSEAPTQFGSPGKRIGFRVVLTE